MDFAVNTLMPPLKPRSHSFVNMWDISVTQVGN